MQFLKLQILVYVSLQRYNTPHINRHKIQVVYFLSLVKLILVLGLGKGGNSML